MERAIPMHNPGEMANRQAADPVSKLIFELSKLPGIGEKTATRLAYYILKQDESYSRALSEAVMSAKQRIHLCGQCFTFTDVDPCRICANPERDRALICVVERPSDLFSIESTGGFRGLYHVLHGALSPLHGVGPEQLRIANLQRRVEAAGIDELILATNPTVEGEATATYLSRLFKASGVKVTRIATGVPAGSDIEYADEVTMQKAMEGRREL